MHYDDIYVYDKQRLVFVAYKHSTLRSHRVNKNGSTNRTSVDYVVTSIQECHLFPPYILTNIIKDPYKFVDPILKDEPYEHFFVINAIVRKNEKTKKLETKLWILFDASIKADDDRYFLH